MAPNPRRIDARLQELYDKVPEIECDGSCHGACCFIDCSIRERDRMERASGRKLETVDAAAPGGAGSQVDAHGNLLGRYRCSMLTDDGRCSVYEIRPMVCRMYGVAEGLECHRGCKPPKMLSMLEGAVLLAESLQIGGDNGSRAVESEIRRAMANPEQAHEIRAAARRAHEAMDAALEKADKISQELSDR